MSLGCLGGVLGDSLGLIFCGYLSQAPVSWWSLSQDFFFGDIFLMESFLRDTFEVPLAGTSFSGPFFGMCLGCLLDAVCECSRDAFLIFRPQMLICRMNILFLLNVSWSGSCWEAQIKSLCIWMSY